ncbi:MAG: hypothetical protein QG614_249 [Patescibacteria group bacterium]|nr:hypothetical protein [Patescibacteria group bacterium]
MKRAVLFISTMSCLVFFVNAQNAQVDNLNNHSGPSNINTNTANIESGIQNIASPTNVVRSGPSQIGAVIIDQATVYSPNTQNLNFVDAVSLRVYCSMSKVFNSNERDKCYININNNDYTNSVLNNVNNLRQQVAGQEQEINSLKERASTGGDATTNTVIKYINMGIAGKNGKGIANTKQNVDGSITFLYTDGTSFTTGPITGSVVVNDTNHIATNTQSAAVGYYNTVLSSNSYIIGRSNLASSSATSSITIGNNIINDIASSTMIGASNQTKLFIGADGFVGIASSTSGGARTSRLADEQLRVGGRIRAHGFDVDAAADLAENFPADEQDISPGHIVQFSDILHSWSPTGKSDDASFEMNGVVKAVVAKSAIGVIATNPGIVLGSNTEGVPVAFSGRVPVKVSAENGPVQKGDRITLSYREAGVGAKLMNAGQSVGIALSSDTGSGVVLMLVKNEYVYDPTLVLEGNESSVTNTSLSKTQNKMCIDEVCVDKTLLQKIISFFNSVSPSNSATNTSGNVQSQ